MSAWLVKTVILKIVSDFLSSWQDQNLLLETSCEWKGYNLTQLAEFLLNCILNKFHSDQYIRKILDKINSHGKKIKCSAKSHFLPVSLPQPTSPLVKEHSTLKLDFHNIEVERDIMYKLQWFFFFLSNYSIRRCDLACNFSFSNSSISSIILKKTRIFTWTIKLEVSSVSYVLCPYAHSWQVDI